jgi:RNA polymerase sigma factor (sigma-70 family)
MAKHDGLVQAVARRQCLGELPFGEAIQAGRQGLWRAILGYDPERGIAFSSYAWPSISRTIWRLVKEAERFKSEPLAEVEPLLGAGHSPDPALLWEATSIQLALQGLVERLPARLGQVIVARYGFNGHPPATYRQIGAALALSGERVRQLQTEALVWLRHPAHDQSLRSLLNRHTVADYQLAQQQAQLWLRRRGGRHNG